MVDAVLSKISELHQRTSPTSATHVPVQSGSFHHVAGSARLAVILPYWHSKPSRFTSFRSRLHAKGVSTLYYDIGPDMLQAHVEQVLYNFTVAADAMCDEITAIRQTFGLPHIDIYSFSLGNTFTGLLATRVEGIDNLRMIVPGDSLAASFWRSIATRRIRLALEAKGVTEADLLAAWAPLAPITYASALANTIKHIEITLARADKFIPYDRGMNLVSSLESYGANVEVHRWRSGHGAAVLRYLRTR